MEGEEEDDHLSIYDHPPSLQHSIQYQSNTITIIGKLKVKGAVISGNSMNQAIIVIY